MTGWRWQTKFFKEGAKRHRKLHDYIQGIPKLAIRRLAHRGGIKRISGLVYDETTAILKIFLSNVIHDAVAYKENVYRSTITAENVVRSIKVVHFMILVFNAIYSVLNPSYPIQ